MHRHDTDPASPGSPALLLTLDDVDHLLTSTAIRCPAVRLVQDGQLLPESQYTRGGTLAGKPLTGLVDPRKVLDLFADGATVVLQGLQRYWPPLTRLVDELELELGHPGQVNAYLTPPGAQGFDVHADAHDVFVVQTHGRKLWSLPGEAEPELLLTPGRSVYLPTGTLHSARTQDAPSLHLTIGVQQVTWQSVVREVVGPLVAELDDSHLPAGYLADPSVLRDGLADRLSTLVEALRAADAEGAAQAQAHRFLSSRPSRLAGGLRDVLQLNEIDVSTTLARRPAHPCTVVEDGDTARVLLGDRVLTVPAWTAPAVHEIASRERLTPGGLTTIDEASAVVLCRRLVREGLLRVMS